MISKAKGIIKRKLKETGTEHQPVARSQSLPVESKEQVVETEEEREFSQVLCPLELEELGKTTIRVRDQVHSPQVLYSRNCLHKTLKDWIPVLFRSLNSLKHVTSKLETSPSLFKQNDSVQTSTLTVPKSNTAEDLIALSKSQILLMKKLLGEEQFASVCFLTKMCLDVGLFSPGSGWKSQRHNKKCEPQKDIVMACPIAENKAIENSDKNSTCSNGLVHKISNESCGNVQEDCLVCKNEEPLDVNCDKTDPQNTVAESDDYASNSRIQSEEMDDKVEIKYTRDADTPLKKVQYDYHETNMTSTNIIDETLHGMSTLISDIENQQDFITCGTCSKNFTCDLQHRLSRSMAQASADNIGSEDMDWNRAMFIRTFFKLLNVKDIRRTLSLTRGIKWRTWQVVLGCIREFSEPDVVTRHIEDGHVTRALHVLHDGIHDYPDTLLLHLNNLYKKNGRETVTACARMFPDVFPWEVMEMCRQSNTYDLVTRAQYFVYYVEQLMRWRANIREKRSHTLKTLAKDKEFIKVWFHSALVASNPEGQKHCECGLPRSGSHRMTWKHGDHLNEIIELVSERSNGYVPDMYLNMCWKHGYWAGFLRLCSFKGFRQLALQSIVCLGDVKLLKTDGTQGSTLQSLEDWKTLLKLVASRDSHHSQSCDQHKDSDWLPDMTWENVVNLALKQLGPSRLIPLLKDVPYTGKALPREFYYKCIMGAVIEKEQTKLIHEMLTKVDTYLWSKRAGVLTPQMNFSRIQEQIGLPNDIDSTGVGTMSMSHVKTLEDTATNWGVNIHLAEASCPVCCLQLSEQVSSSNQGLLVFECGHVFHKYCVPEQACVVCFFENLKTISKTATNASTQSTSKME